MHVGKRLDSVSSEPVKADPKASDDRRSTNAMHTFLTRFFGSVTKALRRIEIKERQTQMIHVPTQSSHSAPMQSKSVTHYDTLKHDNRPERSVASQQSDTKRHRKTRSRDNSNAGSLSQSIRDSNFHIRVTSPQSARHTNTRYGLPGGLTLQGKSLSLGSRRGV